MRIRRTKTGEGGPDGLPSSTTVHWAKAADVQGSVILWTPDEADAADFDAAAIRKIRAHYADRPRAGTLEFFGEPQEVELEGPRGFPLEDDLRRAVAEIARLQKANAYLELTTASQRDVITGQAAEIESLRRDLEQATAPLAHGVGNVESVEPPHRRGPGRPRKVTQEDPPHPADAEGQTPTGSS